jgi:hypothetical protein
MSNLKNSSIQVSQDEPHSRKQRLVGKKYIGLSNKNVSFQHNESDSAGLSHYADETSNISLPLRGFKSNFEEKP